MGIHCIGGYRQTTQSYAYKMHSDWGGEMELVGTLSSGGYIRVPHDGREDDYIYFNDITSFPYTIYCDVGLYIADDGNTHCPQWYDPHEFRVNKTDALTTADWILVGPNGQETGRDTRTHIQINSDGKVYLYLNKYGYYYYGIGNIVQLRAMTLVVGMADDYGSGPIPGVLYYCWKLSENGSSEISMIWQGLPTLGTLYYSPNHIISPIGYIGFEQESVLSTWETWDLYNPYDPESLRYFYWKTNDEEDAQAIATGQPISSVITALKWSQLQTRINTLELAHGHALTQFTEVHSGDRITSQLYGEIYNALSGIGYTPTYNPAQGDRIYPYHFNGTGSIKAKCNEAIGDL